MTRWLFDDPSDGAEVADDLTATPLDPPLHAPEPVPQPRPTGTVPLFGPMATPPQAIPQPPPQVPTAAVIATIFPDPAPPSSSPPPAPPPPQPAPVQAMPASAEGALTAEQIRKALPPGLHSAVTPSFVSLLNNVSLDPETCRNIRENFLSYTSVLQKGQFKTEDYLNAVAYVSYKMMGHSNEESYARALPERYARLVAKNTPKKDIAAHVSGYNKGKLVNLILEQSIVPSWVLNQDLHQRALNHLADLMVNATSEKVQAEAAIGLLAALKRPDKIVSEMSIQISENTGMQALREQQAELARMQHELIQKGALKAVDVAGSKLIDHAAQDAEVVS